MASPAVSANTQVALITRCGEWLADGRILAVQRTGVIIYSVMAAIERQLNVCVGSNGDQNKPLALMAVDEHAPCSSQVGIEESPVLSI